VSKSVNELYNTEIMPKSTNRLEKLSSIKDRGQTDRVTALYHARRHQTLTLELDL